MNCEIEITIPLRVVVTRYQRGDQRKGDGDELEFEAYLPGGSRVYNEDLGLESEDIDSLVWDEIDRARREDAA